MRAGLVLIGTICAVALMAGESGEEMRHRHAAEATAVNGAIDLMEGIPDRGAYVGRMQFKTDESGRLYALYADGWQPVRMAKCDTDTDCEEMYGADL